MTIPNVDLRYQLTIQRPDGTVRTVRKGQSESFVVQFVDHLRCAFKTSNEPNVTTAGGSSVTLRNPDFTGKPFLDVNAGSGTKDRGPTIGDGGTAVSVTDNTLDSKLAANIQYADTSVQAVTTSDPTAEFSVQRDFTNTRSTTVTVRETGLICQSQDNSGTLRNFLLIRDTVDPTDIQTNETASLEYIVEITA